LFAISIVKGKIISDLEMIPFLSLRGVIFPCYCESRLVGTKQSRWGWRGWRLPRFARNDKKGEVLALEKRKGLRVTGRAKGSQR